MRVRWWLIGLIAIGWASAAAAEPAPCPAPPALEPTVPIPTAIPASWADRTAAVKAHRAWSAPRMSYGACKRAEIERLGARVNLIAAQINDLVDDANAVDHRLRAARADRLAAYRAFAARRKVKQEDWPVAATVTAPTLTPPCPAPPASTPPPAFPNGPNAREMRLADASFQTWSAPQEAYLQCRKAERAAMGNAFDSAKAQYEAARADYAAYRNSFNNAVTQFESALARYTARIPSPYAR